MQIMADVIPRRKWLKNAMRTLEVEACVGCGPVESY